MALSDIPEGRARHINHFTRGHPLALTLAAATLTEGSSANLEDLALYRVIEELARMYVAEISDEMTRRAIEAASVVRCANVSLLRAMLPEAAPQDLYERLRSIPLVQVQRDGLQVHDSLQQAIASAFKASDPNRYLRYRRAAWRQLRTEVRSVPVSELWRYTADMLYWLENPAVREAFFPTDSPTSRWNRRSLRTLMRFLTSPATGMARKRFAVSNCGGNMRHELLCSERFRP